MSEHERISGLVAWYANGSLGPGERAAVETHLRGCAECRGLLEQARGQVELARVGPLERHLDHVEPSLLVLYAEDAHTLDVETRGFIERRLAACATCREALDNLRAVDLQLAGAPRAAPEPPPTADAVSPAARGAGGVTARIWRALAATLLRPAPALAYLVLLAALLPVAWRALDRGAPGVRGPALTPERYVLESRRATRGATDEPPASVTLAADTGAPAVLLELRTDLRRHDLADEGLSFTLELRRDGRLLWSEPRSRDAFDLDDPDRATLSLLLVPARLGPGPLDVVLRAHKPGDPLDGQALFRAGIRIGG